MMMIKIKKKLNFYELINLTYYIYHLRNNFFMLNQFLFHIFPSPYSNQVWLKIFWSLYMFFYLFNLYYLLKKILKLKFLKINWSIYTLYLKRLNKIFMIVFLMIFNLDRF